MRNPRQRSVVGSAEEVQAYRVRQWDTPPAVTTARPVDGSARGSMGRRTTR